MKVEPCLVHVWYEEAGYKGTRRYVCRVCDATGEAE